MKEYVDNGPITLGNLPMGHTALMVGNIAKMAQSMNAITRKTEEIPYF